MMMRLSSLQNPKKTVVDYIHKISIEKLLDGEAAENVNYSAKMLTFMFHSVNLITPD